MLRLLPLALWAGLIGLGGLWLAAAAFRLEKRALFPVGLALGWALQNLLASLLAYFVPFTTAAWLGGGLTLLAGLSAALLTRRELPARRRLLPPLHPGAAAAFVAISLAAIAMARGTAIFDDYAHLPVVSVTAAGFYPLKFPLDPRLRSTTILSCFSPPRKSAVWEASRPGARWISAAGSPPGWRSAWPGPGAAGLRVPPRAGC